MLEELSNDTDVEPDIIVFYTLMKAFTDNSDMKSAMRVYRSMEKHKVYPDEFVFNALINGCATDYKVTVNDFNELMNKLLSDGMKPNTTTVSIMWELFLLP